MKLNRRSFFHSSIATAIVVSTRSQPSWAQDRQVDMNQYETAVFKPVLCLEELKSPVIIQTLELYKVGNDHIVRSVSQDGATGLAFTNSRANYLYPILEKLVIPFFLGKDARQLESLIDGVYVHNSNYKLSGLAFWNCVAWIEFSLLDLMGKIINKHVSALFGGKVRDTVPIYCASGNRHTTPEEEVEIIQKLIEETGAKAIKFKVGGRMSRNADSIPGRTEKLIPLIRKTLGDTIAIHADSNGSYDARKGIEIGKMCQEQNFLFFEEPCPFDYLEETRQVSEALDIPIAGGEQETSLRRFQWMIENDAVQVVQPDLHYNGGFIRATRVARMAALRNIPITVHMSGDGTGFVDVLNFASFTPTIGAYQEYKGNIDRVGTWYDPPLTLQDGAIPVPTGPGFGIKGDIEIIKSAKKVF